jgi:hypothetical protein
MSFVRSTGFLITLGTGLASFGCSGEAGGTAPSGTAQAKSSDTVSRTVVRLAKNGTRTTTTSVITRAEQLQEIAQKKSLAASLVKGAVTVRDVVLDSGCGNASLWLFDSNFLSGDEICFFADANTNNFRVSLADYIDPGNGIPWAGQVVGIWAGVDQGCLNNSTAVFENGEFINFVAWEQIPDMSICCGDGRMVWTNILYLGGQCEFQIP